VIAPGETCDNALDVFVPFDGSVVIFGSLSPDATNDIESACTDFDSNFEDKWPDLVYRVDFEAACTADITVRNVTSDVEFSVRRDCGEELYCINGNDREEEERFLWHLEGGRHHVIVQAPLPTEFELELTCRAPQCGDGVLNPGEACEDGNDSPLDGCSPTCTIEEPDASLEDCAAASASLAHSINPGFQVIPASSNVPTTLGARDDGHGSCQIPPDPLYPEQEYSADHVYRVRPVVDGMLRVTLGNDRNGDPFCGPVEPSFPYASGCYDRAFFVREGDCELGQEVACSDDAQWWETEEDTFPVIAGVDYYVFADGWLGGYGFDTGQYVLGFELTPD
jgi:cysteine-rich repeat protein